MGHAGLAISNIAGAVVLGVVLASRSHAKSLHYLMKLAIDTCASRTWRSKWKPTGRSSSWARCSRRGNTLSVPNMTVETAVAIAGGFTPRAYRYDFVISRSSMGVTSRQDVPLIAPVRPGDTITVTERWF